VSRTVIRRSGEGLPLEIGPTRNWIKLAAGESGGRIGVIEMELDAGFSGPPRHRHDHIDHLWYVLAGQVDVLIDEEPSRLAAGDFAFVPRGTTHTFANLGGEPATVLEIDAPRTLDGYFAELAQAIPPGTAVDPEVVADIQRRHDTTPSGGQLKDSS